MHIWLVTERDMVTRHIDIGDIMTLLFLDNDEPHLFGLPSARGVEIKSNIDANLIETGTISSDSILGNIPSFYQISTGLPFNLNSSNRRQAEQVTIILSQSPTIYASAYFSCMLVAA